MRRMIIFKSFISFNHFIINKKKTFPFVNNTSEDNIDPPVTHPLSITLNSLYSGRRMT